MVLSENVVSNNHEIQLSDNIAVMFTQLTVPSHSV